MKQYTSLFVVPRLCGDPSGPVVSGVAKDQMNQCLWFGLAAVLRNEIEGPLSLELSGG